MHATYLTQMSLKERWTREKSLPKEGKMKKKIGEDDGDAWRELGDRQWSHEELGSFNGGKGLEGEEEKMRER